MPPIRFCDSFLKAPQGRWLGYSWLSNIHLFGNLPLTLTLNDTSEDFIMARPQAFELPLLDSLRNSSWLHVFFSLRKLIVNMDQPKHSYSARECPICKGMCKLVQFNSLAPGEEIQKAIEDRKRLIDKLRDLDD